MARRFRATVDYDNNWISRHIGVVIEKAIYGNLILCRENHNGNYLSETLFWMMSDLAKIVSVSLIFVSTNFSFFFYFQIFRYRWFQSIRSSWYIFTKLSHSGRRWRCGLAETWILRSQRPYPGKDPWFRTRSILCSLCRKWPVRIRLAQELVRQKAVSKIRRKFQSRTFGAFTIEKTRSRAHQDSFPWLVFHWLVLRKK